MRFPPPILAMLLLLCACAPTARLEAQASRGHLDQLDHFLADTSSHLTAASRGLRADTHGAAQELDGGVRSLARAQALTPLLRQDIQALSDSAVSLQKQIDAHRNDLLGPRAIRIRNRLIFAGILISIGAALLHFGPILGGPLGGGAILVGHLFTAFAVPIFSAAVAVLRKSISFSISLIAKIPTWLESLARSKSALKGTPNAPASAH